MALNTHLKGEVVSDKQPNSRNETRKKSLKTKLVERKIIKIKDEINVSKQ